MPDSRFASQLTEQIGNEFAAEQQYIAIAVHYDADALPQLAALFYRQAVEERNHAMIMVQYLLDATSPWSSRASPPRRPPSARWPSRSPSRSSRRSASPTSAPTSCGSRARAATSAASSS